MNGRTETNRCYSATAEFSNLYVSSEGVVSFEGVDLFNEISLITAKCGRGKTHFALSLGEEGLLNRINNQLTQQGVEPIQPEEVLFLTSRTVIKQQQLLKNPHAAAEYAVYDWEGWEVKEQLGKIRISTAHNFGSLLQQKAIKVFPKLVVVDEFHSVLAETVFADKLFYAAKWLEEDKTAVKVGLTATPQFLTDYIAHETTFKFKVVDMELGSKYKTTHITISTNAAAERFVRTIKPNKDNRVLVYIRAASTCYNLSKQFPNSAFLISQFSKKKDKETGELLTDIMKAQGVLEYIKATGMFPDNTYIIFLNSAYREGLDLMDTRVKRVVVEAPDLLTIEQVLGRLRQDIEQLDIISNLIYENDLDKKTAEMKQLIDNLEAAAEYKADRVVKIVVDSQLENQQKEEGKNYLFLNGDKHEVNNYAKSFFKYQRDYYNILKRSMNAKYSDIEGNHIDNLKQYFTKALQKYTNNPITFINGNKHITQLEQDNIIGSFNFEPYLNVPLTTQDKKRLCEEVRMDNGNGRVVKWETLKSKLVEHGYSVVDKQVGVKRTRVSVISG